MWFFEFGSKTESLNKVIYALIVITMCVSACLNVEKYTPDGLRLLTKDEMFERARRNQFPDPNTVIYKYENGETVAQSDVPNIDFISYTTDPYVDKNGRVIELVLRLATPRDKVLYSQLQVAFNEGLAVEKVPVDCSEIRDILQEVYNIEQNKALEEPADRVTERKNLAFVASIIDSCGMPTLKQVNEQQMSAIWMAIQNSNPQDRQKYLPYLVEAAAKGDMKESSIAITQDKVMMETGRPQIYGTQVFVNPETGYWELYDTEDWEFVDRRRADIGFGTLKEYLLQFDIEFNVEQH